MTRDIDRPLGQAPTPKKAGAAVRPGRRTVAALIGALAIGAASVALVVFREDPLRTPAATAASPSATIQQEVAAAAPADPIAEAKEGARTGDSPSIIQVSRPARDDADSVLVIRDPAAVGQNPRLAHLPDRALIEQSEQGPLPVRAADGRRPVDVYARPWSGAGGLRIAIVIGGLGLSQTGTQAAIAALPSEVTLAFAPQGNSISRWMQAARREGHEIIMQVPLEPYDYPSVNPGRNTLTVNASDRENLRDLRWALSRTTNYTGVMNYMGARFSADAEAMEPIIAELGERGLLYLDDGSSARSVAEELAQAHGVPFAESDAAIDVVREPGEIVRKLEELERIAHARGFAVGVGSAFDVTVAAVAAWADKAKKRGVEIVPISAVAVDPARVSQR